jgi:hypothetical protein
MQEPIKTRLGKNVSITASRDRPLADGGSRTRWEAI